MVSTQLSGDFASRTAKYFQRAAHSAPEWYDADGNWKSDSQPAQTRERFWICFALYAVGDNALADAIIRQSETRVSHLNIQNAISSFDIFHSNIAAALLMNHREKMAPDMRAKLEFLVRESFDFSPGNRQADFQFHGYNDNMPAKATMGLILGGEMLNEPAVVEYGLWNLRQFGAQLSRRGINSEFNSPTYSPLAIHAMSHIAECAQNEDARALALQIEARLWLDVAARFHPEMGVVAGPHSRAYTADTLAHGSLLASLLWFVLGEAARPSPMLFFEPDSGLVLHHEGDVPFNIAQMCWTAASHYHIPDAARELFAIKDYPFRAVATSEQGDANPDWPARVGRIETFLQTDFALGTASTPFVSGEQTMSYFVTYKRQSEVASFRDVGTVFTKFVINDDEPGAIPLSKYSNSNEQSHLQNYSNSLVLQHHATALVLTHPHLSLGGLEATPATPLHRLRELVIFPSHFGGADEIRVGTESLADWSSHVAAGQWIGVRRGRLLMAVRPLAYSREFGHAQISLETNDNYQVIQSQFYEGEAREFSRAQLRATFGGFVAEHASIDDYPSLSAFMEALAPARFSDYLWTTRRVRYLRPQTENLAALDIETSWSAGAHEQRFATINGRNVDWPTLEIDGINAEEVPLINQSPPKQTPFFPWPSLSIVGQNQVSAIGDCGA